jgi:hypothetical protein
MLDVFQTSCVSFILTHRALNVAHFIRHFICNILYIVTTVSPDRKHAIYRSGNINYVVNKFHGTWKSSLHSEVRNSKFLPRMFQLGTWKQFFFPHLGTRASVNVPGLEVRQNAVVKFKYEVTLSVASNLWVHSNEIWNETVQFMQCKKKLVPVLK